MTILEWVAMHRMSKKETNIKEWAAAYPNYCCKYAMILYGLIVCLSQQIDTQKYCIVSSAFY